MDGISTLAVKKFVSTRAPGKFDDFYQISIHLRINYSCNHQQSHKACWAFLRELPLWLEGRGVCGGRLGRLLRGAEGGNLRDGLPSLHTQEACGTNKPHSAYKLGDRTKSLQWYRHMAEWSWTQLNSVVKWRSHTNVPSRAVGSRKETTRGVCIALVKPTAFDLGKSASGEQFSKCGSLPLLLLGIITCWSLLGKSAFCPMHTHGHISV